jgi:hypothetical protein
VSFVACKPLTKTDEHPAVAKVMPVLGFSLVKPREIIRFIPANITILKRAL